MISRATRQGPVLFLAGISLLLSVACQQENESAEPSAADSSNLRVAEFLSFTEAMKRNQVAMGDFNLGAIARAGMQPQHRIDIAPRTSFDSDPLEISPDSELLLTAGLLSLGSTIPEDDRPIFRVDAIGPRGETRLLELTGQVDFEIDEWSSRRVPLPTDIGSPVTVRFSITPPENSEALSAAATPLWGAPRLLRPSKNSRSNVLFVVFDTLRADHTQPYGYDRETTPFLSQLAKQGALAEEVVTTYPTTLVSHWSMFTGLFPARHGIYSRQDSLDRPSDYLPRIFQEAGYRTSAFTEGGFVHSLFGFAKGFDLYHNGAKTNILDLSGSAETTFDHALEWLEDAKNDSFFLFLHTYQVHTPYEPPASYRKMFEGENYGGRWHDRYPAMATFPINNRQIEVTDEEFAHIMNLYDAEIRELDDLFAQFWSRLEAMGILENTIVVITSDHGEDFVEHGWLNHGTTLYDPALMVPLIIVAPEKVPSGTRLKCQRSSTDLMPTVLDLAGLPIPDDLDGQSMLSDLRLGHCKEDSAAYSELVNATYDRQDDLPIVSLRKDGWKLIRHLESGALEAYDLRQDPGEMRNIPSEANEEFVDELDAYIETRPGFAPEDEKPIPPELHERLKALGYVDPAE